MRTTIADSMIQDGYSVAVIGVDVTGAVDDIIKIYSSCGSPM